MLLMEFGILLWKPNMVRLEGALHNFNYFATKAAKTLIYCISSVLLIFNELKGVRTPTQI